MIRFKNRPLPGARLLAAPALVTFPPAAALAQEATALPDIDIDSAAIGRASCRERV